MADRNGELCNFESQENGGVGLSAKRFSGRRASVVEARAASSGPVPARKRAPIVRTQEAYRLSAVLIDKTTKAPKASVRVEAWDASGHCTDALAFARTDARGQFTLRLSREAVAGLLNERRPVVELRLFSSLGAALPDPAWRWTLGPATVRARIEVRSGGGAPTREPSACVVRGRVRTFRGVPVNAARVLLYDASAGLSLLNEHEVDADRERTDAAGFYTVPYQAAAPRDLVVHIVEAGTGRILAQSRRFNHAPPVLNVDLSVGGAFRGPSEHEEFTARMAEATGSGVFHGTVNDDTIDRIASRMDVPREQVARLAAASRISADSPLDEAVVYGLLRTGLPESKEEFLRTPPAEIRRRLHEALGRNYLPASKAGLVDNVVRQFQAAARSAAFPILSDEEDNPNAVVGTMLGSVLSGPAAVGFVARHLAHEGASEDFWAALPARGGLDNATARRARFALRAAALSLPSTFATETPRDVLGSGRDPAVDYDATYYLPLVERLVADRAAGTLGSLRDLARRTDAQIDTLVAAVGAPRTTPGRSATARRKSYAKHLRETVRRAFPTTAIAAELSRSESSGNEEVTAFFDDPANEGFVLGKTRVARHLATTTGALARIGADRRAALVSNLKAVERLYKLTDDSTQIQRLHGAGLRSAAAVHALGVVGVASATGMTLAEAKPIVQTACAVSGAALALQAAFGSPFHLSQAGSGFIVNQTAIETNLGPPLVDWEALFGSESTCQCEHCHSVLSPAAYLVEVLQFLDDIKLGIRTARDVLLSPGIEGIHALHPRRPDIAKIDLSCPNTDTPLPYVDLVNEILEHVAGALIEHDDRLDYPDHLATNGAAPDLLAAPEVKDPGARAKAYQGLVSQPHPFSLPFHFWLTEARAFAPQLGVPLHALAHALQPGGPPTGLEDLPPPYAYDTRRAWERLGLWAEARDVLLGTAPGTPQSKWGFEGTEATWATDLLVAETFLAKSGLSYDELRSLLGTQYIRSFLPSSGSPRPTLSQTGPIVTCDLAKIRIQGLPTTAWAGLHRFLRLRHRLGYTIDQTDYAVTTFASAVDDALLRKLAIVEHFRVDRKTDVSVVLSWFGPIDTRPRGLEKQTSFYERLFQNPAVLHPVDDAFRLADMDGLDSPEALADETSFSLGGHAMAIRAALRLSAQDFALLTDTATARAFIGVTWPIVPVGLPAPAEDGQPAAARLTLAHLSTLHRIATWARALDLSIQDLLALARLWGIESFTSLAPETVYLVSQAADRLREGGLTPTDLLFVIHGLTTSGSALVPPAGALADLEAKLGAALFKVRAAIPSAVSAAAEQVRALLELLPLGPEDVDSAMAAFTENPEGREGWFGETLLPYFAHEDAADRFLGEDDELDDVDTRLAYAYGHLRAYVEGEKTIAQTLGAALRLSPDVAYKLALRIEDAGGHPLLTQFRLARYASSGPPSTAPVIDEAEFLRLSRAARLLAALEATPAELDALFVVSAATASADRLIDLNAMLSDDGDKELWFRRWLLTVALWKLRASLPGGSPALLALFQGPGVTSASLVLGKAARIIGWAPADVAALAGHFTLGESGGANLGSGTPKVPDIARRLVRLHAAFNALQPFRTDAATVIGSWLSLGTALVDEGGVDEDKVEAAAQASAGIVRAVKARYDDGTWPDVARPLRDAVREKQRDALVTYLLSTGYARNEDELFAWLLVDTETSPAVLTSRIKQAMSSVQTFVQRAELGLEPNVTLTAAQVDQWKWMKNYRVWEANRKIFLYPENWLEPALRDDKTGFFKDFESEIRRQDITDETAEEAFAHYLERVADVAELEVVAVHADATTVHLVGRTRTSPRAYYYRTGTAVRSSARTWTPWERIDLDVESEHFLLFESDRSLSLVWATIEEKPNAKQPESQAGDEPPRTHLEIGISLSERRNGRFTPPRASLGRLSTEKLYENLTTRSDSTQPATYDLRPEDVTLASDELGIRCLVNPWRLLHQSATPGELGWSASDFLVLGQFRIDPCRLSIDAWPTKSLPLLQCERDLSGATSELEKLEAEKEKYLRQIDAHEKAKSDDVIFSTLTPEGAAEYREALDAAIEDLEEDVTRVDGEIAERKDECPIIMKWKTNLTSPSQRVWVQAPLGVGEWRFQGQAALMTSAGPVEVTDGDRITGLLSFGQPWMTTMVRPLVLTGSGSTASPLKEVGAPEPTTTPTVLHLDQGVFLVDRLVSYDVSKGYRLTRLSNPTACKQLVRLRQDGIDGLMNDRVLQISTSDLLSRRLSPGVKANDIGAVPFGTTGASSIYNWELYFHAPLFIASRLTAARRYDEARKWLERIFDPTPGTPAPGEANKPWAKLPGRYWKLRPFYMNTDLAAMSEALVALDQDTDTDAKADLIAQIDAWRAAPFRPYAVARLRPAAFQKAVVQKYIENLLAWGDDLFRRETLEAINEAAGLYILARDLLGPRPPKIAPASSPPPKMVEDLLTAGLFGNALVETESLVATHPGGSCGGEPPPRLLTQYFCVPGNEKVDELRDTVADRLFKIRHSMNIDGVFRELALFEPPIDPALLVAAAAAGVDIDSVLNDLSGGRLPYRYPVLHGRAVDLAAGVVQLGQSLLAALEKQDGEGLSLLRSGQEVEILEAQRQAKAFEVKEAETALAAAKAGRTVIEWRRDHYAALIEAGQIDLEKDVAAKSAEGRRWQIAGSALSSVASGLSVIPDVVVGVMGFMAGSLTKAAGGEKLAGALRFTADGMSFMAAGAQHEASMLTAQAAHARRIEDWLFQVQNADAELAQSAKQIAAAEIRVAIAQVALATHDRQTANARAVDEYMRSKLTSGDLYEWMADRLMDVYYEAYKLAYDMAKRAERAMRTELAIPDGDARFITFGYWDSARKGLTAGEQLQQALRALDVAYHERNKRELEITKQFSLASFAPEKLLALRETGGCDVDLEEKHFDYDHPGHYLRRIKSVSVTIPAVAGPYTAVSARLALTKNRMRTTTLLGEGYVESNPTLGTDTRFARDVVPIESVVTSSAQNDAGVFELVLRDDRYLPFEGAGAISTFHIDLPRETNGFDVSTISDLVLHVRYTARDGGLPLRDAAKAAVVTPKRQGLKRLFSARSDFPDAWHTFMNPDPAASEQELALPLTAERFPYLYGNKPVTAKEVRVLAKWKPDVYSNASKLSIGLLPTGGTLQTLELEKLDLAPLAEDSWTTTGSFSTLDTWRIKAASTSVAVLPSSLRTLVGDKHRLNDTLVDILFLVTYEQDVG